MRTCSTSSTKRSLVHRVVSLGWRCNKIRAGHSRYTRCFLLESSRHTHRVMSQSPPHVEVVLLFLIITYGFRPYFKVPCGVLIESF
jgi:hypothetical protein